MKDPYTTSQLLILRKVTRAIADHLRTRLNDHLAALTPLFRPKTVLGDYVQGSGKDPSREEATTFKELENLYRTIAGSNPFNLTNQLKPSVEILNTTLALSPMEYTISAQGERQSKSITVTSPFKWVLSFSGFEPTRMKELLADRHRSTQGLQDFIVHYLVLHLISKQRGLLQLFEAFRFPITSERASTTGSLPITCISSCVSSLLPSNDVVIQSTELSGTDTFEEVINLDDITKMKDPLKQQLVDLVKSHGKELLPAS